MDWNLKIHAFLHDPPHKPLVLGVGHEKIGRRIAGEITGRGISEEGWERCVKAADRAAAGADRETFLPGLTINPRTELSFIHPLDAQHLARRDGERLKFAEIVITEEGIDHARRIVEGGDGDESVLVRCLGPNVGGIDDRLRFMLLWRFVADILRSEESRTDGSQRMGALWEVLPADTRMPSHPLLAHASLTSALAGIFGVREDPALLRFSVGPVQGFIESARKLSDLWAGSAILSESVWKALEVIVERFGPDSVVFPILRDVFFFDMWLLGLVGGFRPLPEPLDGLISAIEERKDRAMRMPSLPNIFVAILPFGEASKVAKEAAEAVRTFWESSAKDAARELNGVDAAMVERAAGQAKSLVEVYWSVVPWPSPAAEFEKAIIESSPRCSRWAWHAEKPRAERFFHISEVLKDKGYKPNRGVLYADAFDQGCILVDAAKRERLFERGREEWGLKCSLCGVREVLLPGDFWQQRVARGASSQKGYLKKNEALCGPCLWKRLYGRESEFGRHHPSTGEIAASRFKLDVIKACKDGKVGLLAAVESFVKESEGIAEAIGVKVWCVQAIEDAIAGFGENHPLCRFAHLDGQYLLPFPREEGGEEVEVDLQGLRRCAKWLRDSASRVGIEMPRPYLAVVLFDGDRMGEWLSGTHENTPKALEMLHKRARNQLSSEECKVLEETSRALTPAIHAAISEACSTFATITAPMTVEGEGLAGHLVYAGGDDALFVAPVPDALELVRRLRLRFSGHPQRFDGDRKPPVGVRGDVRPWVTAWRGKHGIPRPGLEVVRMAFGKRATASAGMCVFHYTAPLSMALEEARLAEKRAKGELGRDALGITILRHSGSITETGIPFFTETNDQVRDNVSLLLDLIDIFSRDEMSPRLATQLAAKFEALRPDAKGVSDRTIWDMAFDLIPGIVGRREAPEEVRERVTEDIKAIAEVIRAGKGRGPSKGVRWLADLVGSAAFFARGGRE